MENSADLFPFSKFPLLISTLFLDKGVGAYVCGVCTCVLVCYCMNTILK